MRGVIIRDGVLPDGGGGLDFDLADVLAALGERVAASHWRARGLWYTSRDGKAIETLERLGDGATVEGRALLDILSRVAQIIDGEFTAVDGDGTRPWVIVRAVDSSWWEVLSDESAVLAPIRAHFRAVQYFPVLPT